MFDRKKFEELKGRVIGLKFETVDDEVMNYEFVFENDEIYMNSSLYGKVFICGLDELRLDRMKNYKEITRWFRELGIEIAVHIIENQCEDWEIFDKCCEDEFEVSVYLGEIDDEGNIIEWNKESKFYIDEHI